MAPRYLKRIAGTFVYIISICLVSCGHQLNSSDTQQDAARVAKLVCESRELTHQKFTLARQYQQLDAPNQNHLALNKEDEIRKKLDQEKNSVIKLSQAKSDSVEHLLKTLWNTKYQTKKEKKLLDDATADELKKQCPLSAP